MNRFLATFMSAYQSPADGQGSDLGGAGALDVESRIDAVLSGNEGATKTEEGGEEGGEGEDPDLTKETNPKSGEDEPVSEDDDQTLAAALGLPEDSLNYDDEGNVVFNAIIDGQKTPVKIQDLVKSYQLEGHVTKKSMKLETDRREFEQTRDTAYDHLTKRINVANNLIGTVEKQLLSEFQNIDWNTLRATDPAEWAASRQYFTERMQQIEAIKAQVGSTKTELTVEQQQANASKQQQFLAGEISKMIVDHPTWSDQSVMAKEVGEIGKFINSTYGFTAEEIANNMDARLMRLIHDAYAYRSGKDTLKEKKIPSNVPKFRSAGQQNTSRKDVQKQKAAQAKKVAIHKSGGSIDSIAASLVDRM